MSDDLMTRLREVPRDGTAKLEGHDYWCRVGDLVHEAADRLEQINELYLEYVDISEERAVRIKKLEAALRQVIGILDDPTGGQHVADMRSAALVARAALGEKMGMYRHKMPDREQSSEMSRADYWEAQASMWHENYKEAVVHEGPAMRFREVLETMAKGCYTAERMRQMAIKALAREIK